MDTAPAQAPTPRPAVRGKWVAGISLVVVAIGGLTTWAFLSPGALAYYKTPSEVRAMHLGNAQGNTSSTTLRIGGRVADGSLERIGRLTFFTITDGKRQIRVEYHGEVPDTLKDGTDAIAEGNSWTIEGAFAADRVQAKCSSKFVPKQRPGDLGKT